MSIPQYIKSIIQRQDNKITKIELNNGLFDKDIPELIQLLNDNSYITELDLYRNNIGDASSQALSQLRYIKKLNVSLNNFSDEGIKPLVLNQNFSHLDLSRNNLSDVSAYFIEIHSKQSWINISENPKISEDALRRVNENVNTFKNIEMLSKAIFCQSPATIGRDKVKDSSVKIEPRF